MTLTEEDITLIRKIAHDVFWEILDVEALPLLRDFATAKLSSSDVSKDISGMKGKGDSQRQEEKRVWNWNPQQITWAKAEGFKGQYERSEDLNSLDFKAMLKDLAEHKGSLTRDGIFYWTFQNGSTVGRKKLEEKANGDHHSS